MSSYAVLASNLLTSNNYSFAINAIPMQAGEVVTDIYFDFGKVPVGFQSVVGPTLSVIASGNAELKSFISISLMKDTLTRLTGRITLAAMAAAQRRWR